MILAEMINLMTTFNAANLETLPNGLWVAFGFVLA